MSLALALAPNGRLFIEDSDEPSSIPGSDVAKRIRRAFSESNSSGLLHLATVELGTDLPTGLAFWRDFGRTYLTQLCHTQGVESGAQPVALPPRTEIEAMVESAPPMTGLEYLNAAVLEALWRDLDEAVRGEMKGFPGGAQAYLRTKNPIWNLVGRVSFHLAENKRDPDNPFAFLATYSSRVSKQARLQYLPLGKALEEYAGARNRNALLSLLIPVQQASDKSSLVRELVASGAIFHPLAWTPQEAYRFLQDIPILEESGILVRVPDWWKSGRPRRPAVSVRIGDRKAQKLGWNALLDFSVSLTLDGEPLTDEELQSILNSTQGLVLLKGKWVEIDRDKLSEVLQQWKKVEAQHRRAGISFLEGMRLLAGAGLTTSDQFVAREDTRDWSAVTAGEWLREVLSELRDPDRIQECDPGRDLKAELRPYQKVGLGWLWFMYRLGLGACLADDMGLGKTIQVLSLFLLARRERQRDDNRRWAPSVVVVPASLVANWKAEIEAFAPSLSVFYAHPAETAASVLDDLGRDSSPLSATDLVITSYSMLLRLPWLREVEWDVAVLDEAQAIKNPAARQTRAAKELKASVRIVLTGTPVENRLSDLWSLIDFACPGLLGSAKAFSQFAKSAASGGQNQYGPIRALVRPYILRRLKTDRKIIADLPDKTEVRAFCALSRTQAALYQQSVEELAEKLASAEGIQRRGVILAYILRFKQICNHPAQWLGNGEYAAELSGKFQRLRELCEELAARQQRVLVFTQFREITGPLSEFLEGVFRRPGLVLHGGTAVKERRPLIDAFQEENGPPFFVLSLKAGGTGLNLTAASHVIHFDRWWNPAVENQATDRAFRIGQHKNVLVHKFVCRGTVEDKIDSLIEEKKGLARELLDEGGEKLLTEMSNEELLRFVSLDIRSALAE
jgi:non-specific serine/threonine protein kinase